MNLVNLLKGKKTYIVSVLTVLYGVVAHHASFADVAPFILAGALGATVRAAIAKVELAVAEVFAKAEALEAKLPAPVAEVAVKVTKKAEAVVNAAEATVNKDVASK